MTARNGSWRLTPPSLRIGSFLVADDRPCVIIAEAACEHKGSLQDAKRMAKVAKDSGADIVKFQLHLPEAEMIPNSVQFWAGSMDQVLKQVNLSVEDHRALMRYCRTIGIHYLCTAYCAEGIDLLHALGVTAFKIGSGEMTNLPMVRHAARISAKTRKPVIVSTGMSTMEEVAETVAVLKQERAHFMLMNCTSEYPPKAAHINLKLIPALRRRFGVHVGHSDHSPDIWSALGAVACGARVLEKHFTLARRLRGPDWLVSIEPQELAALVEGIRTVEAALGGEKRLYPEERPVRRWARHSVVSLRDIPAGHILTPATVGVKRPGWGVPAKHVDAFYGCVAKRAIPANTLVQWRDVSRRKPPRAVTTPSR